MSCGIVCSGSLSLRAWLVPQRLWCRRNTGLSLTVGQSGAQGGAWALPDWGWSLIWKGCPDPYLMWSEAADGMLTRAGGYSITLTLLKGLFFPGSRTSIFSPGFCCHEHLPALCAVPWCLGCPGRSSHCAGKPPTCQVWGCQGLSRARMEVHCFWDFSVLPGTLFPCQPWRRKDLGRGWLTCQKGFLPSAPL